MVEGARNLLEPFESRTQRQNRGKALRSKVGRSAHAKWSSPSKGRDPIELLEQSNASRVQDLVPIRYGRMLASPFTYLRGSPLVMASDFAATPTTGIELQICGDAHLLNFGLFASPERTLLFDLNDFDETLPGPWEWDVKRLAVSIVVAGRDRGFNGQQCRDAAQAAVQSYRERIREFAKMGNLEVWYSRVDADEILRDVDEFARRGTEKVIRKAQRKTSASALPKLTEVVDGHRRIIDNPPLVEHVPGGLGSGGTVNIEEGIALFDRYLASLSEDRRRLVERYRFVDVARKVVGVGSVGTRCSVVLLLGADGEDPLFLQVKEAQASVIEPYWRKSLFANHGERVVVGQKLMQAAGDIFLGWTRNAQGYDFYFRQLRDMKGSFDVSVMGPRSLRLYGILCGQTLARAHARSGDVVALAGYLGPGVVFDEAVATFAKLYADQNERDYERLKRAVANGKVAAETGI